MLYGPFYAGIHEKEIKDILLDSHEDIVGLRYHMGYISGNAVMVLVDAFARQPAIFLSPCAFRMSSMFDSEVCLSMYASYCNSIVPKYY